MELKDLKVNLGFDDKTKLKLRAIATHAGALADELDAIDNAPKCPNCGGPLDISNYYEGDKVVDTSAYCGNCRD